MGTDALIDREAAAAADGAFKALAEDAAAATTPLPLSYGAGDRSRRQWRQLTTKAAQRPRPKAMRRPDGRQESDRRPDGRSTWRERQEPHDQQRAMHHRRKKKCS